MSSPAETLTPSVTVTPTKRQLPRVSPTPLHVAASTLLPVSGYLNENRLKLKPLGSGKEEFEVFYYYKSTDFFRVIQSRFRVTSKALGDANNIINYNANLSLPDSLIRLPFTAKKIKDPDTQEDVYLLKYTVPKTADLINKMPITMTGLQVGYNVFSIDELRKFNPHIQNPNVLKEDDTVYIPLRFIKSPPVETRRPVIIH